MKKATQIVIDIIIIMASLMCFIYLAYSHYKQEGILFYIEKESEIFCYALCAFCYVRVFKMISKNIKPNWVNWIFAFIPTTLFTMQILFYNSFLHFIDWNCEWSFIKYGEITPYKQFLANDITYNVGFGRYRYLFCFFAMYALCSCVVFLQSKIGKRIIKKIRSSLHSFFGFESASDLDVLLNLYQKERIDSNAIIDYLNSMNCTVGEKIEFERCLQKYPCKMLYEIYLSKFYQLMSEEEYAHYCDILSEYTKDTSKKEN